jgi:hypothetical protein
VDPLYGSPNGQGLYFIDATAGSGERVVCIGRSGRPGQCSTATAAIVIESIYDPAQLQAEWHDHETLRVHLFGGEVVRCSSVVEGIRIELRRLPSANPTPGTWNDTYFALFDGLPDICDDPA